MNLLKNIHKTKGLQLIHFKKSIRLGYKYGKDFRSNLKKIQNNYKKVYKLTKGGRKSGWGGGGAPTIEYVDTLTINNRSGIETHLFKFFDKNNVNYLSLK